jgi:hypothetical protein
MDVVRGNGYVLLLVIDRDAPDECTPRPFAPPGSCDMLSDALGCHVPDPPGDWLAGTRLEVGGLVLAASDYLEPWDAGGGPVDDARTGVSLIVVSRDGDEVAIPLPDVAPPLPTIDDVTSDTDSVTIAWHATPTPSSAVVELSNGTTGSRCHVTSTAPTRLAIVPAGSIGLTVDVRAFAAPETITTAFGDATVWTGEIAGRDL